MRYEKVTDATGIHFEVYVVKFCGSVKLIQYPVKLSKFLQSHASREINKFFRKNGQYHDFVIQIKNVMLFYQYHVFMKLCKNLWPMHSLSQFHNHVHEIV